MTRAAARWLSDCVHAYRESARLAVDEVDHNSPLGKGPSTATLSFAGDQAVTGPLTAPSLACSFPTLGGPTITVLAGTVAPNVSTFTTVSAVQGDAVCGTVVPR